MLEPRAIAANEKLLASTADSWYGAVFSERRTAIIRCQVHRQEGEGMRRWRRDAARETTAKKRKTRTRDPKFGPRPRPREKTHLRAQYIKEIRVTERITIRRWPTSSIRCASNAPPVIRRATPPRDNLMFAPINKRPDLTLPKNRAPTIRTRSPGNLNAQSVLQITHRSSK